MSLSLGTEAGRKLFADKVKMAYQSAGPRNFNSLVDYVSVDGVTTYEFRTMGRGIASRRGPRQSQLTPMGIAHDTVTCTLLDWQANELTDKFDQAGTNAPREIEKLAVVIANALYRRKVQIVIDALDAPTYTGTHTIAVGSPAGMTVGKLLSARRTMKADDIGEPVTMFMTEEQEYDLLVDTGNKFTSADFNAASGANTGDIKQGHFGYNYVLIGSGRDETAASGGTGLPKSSTTRVCFAFVPSSTGYVEGMFEQESNYESDKVSQRSTGLLWAGGVVIDAGGIVEVNCTETD
jgi:hypothetical protein